ncbi:hypothetical protein SAMN05878503_102346 [Cereibacter ovatus]|uniref:Uncharacterized protein n=1 Tax=Cereibacter ovatus TaxID=439529 RepID=A0A285CMZ6_9RHOB|nr:hypothetical protein [Cereibacter ovatus]SNX68907.1 hypothetical protein SAMN05878503_102346 [Cereibacter ovatus]
MTTASKPASRQPSLQPQAWAGGFISTARIEAWRGLAAQLAVRDPVYLPIFERLEIEVEVAKARVSDNPVEAARALVRLRQACAAG